MRRRSVRGAGRADAKGGRGRKLRQTFARFALPMVWDYCEVNPLSDTTGSFKGMSDWVARYIDHALRTVDDAPSPEVATRSATAEQPTGLDLICTDPPYYDAIPYSDLMDFFHIWLRRVLRGLSPEMDAVFAEALGPKWEHGANDGELIDDASRFGGDRDMSKRNYEDGMAHAFGRFRKARGLVRYTGGMPVLAHEIGDAVWRTARTHKINNHEVVQGIIVAAGVIGSKLLEPSIFRALQSERYRSILRQIAARPQMRFRRSEVLARLTGENRRSSNTADRHNAQKSPLVRSRSVSLRIVGGLPESIVASPHNTHSASTKESCMRTSSAYSIISCRCAMR